MATVAELIVKIGAETTGLQRGLKQAESEMKGFQRIGRSMQTVGASMSKFVTLPTLLAAGAGLKLGVDFQSAMEQIHTQAGASQKEVDNLSVSVLNLAKRCRKGPANSRKACSTWSRWGCTARRR